VENDEFGSSAGAEKDDESSELSSLTDDSDEDDEDDEEAEKEGNTSLVGGSLRDISKVTITPHHRAEKHGGRPTRRTAASASVAWSKLTPRGHRLHRTSDSEDDDDDDDEPRTPSKRKKARERKTNDVSSSAVSVNDGTPKRKRGRPRKDESIRLAEERRIVADNTPSQSMIMDAGPSVESTPKRKRGRPRKDEQATPSRAAELPVADDDVFLTESLGPSLIQPSSSDAYFLNHSTRRAGQLAKGKTSDALLSDQFTALAPKHVLSLSKRITRQVQESLDGDDKDGLQLPVLMPLSRFERFHRHWWSLLSDLNRPLLFFGVGSKKAVLQRFARQMADEGRCSVLVVGGNAGGRVEDVVNQLERQCSIAPIADVSKAQRMAYNIPLEARAHHIVSVLADEEERYNVAALPPSVLLLIHNFEAPALLQEKALRVLAILSASTKIHLCMDTAHVNAAMLSGLDSASLYRDRLNWLWIDLTTFVPILDEVISERGTGLLRTLGLPGVMDVRRAGAGSDATALAIDYRPLVGSAAGSMTASGSSAQDGRLLSDQAAVHILRSVTYKARGMFLLLAQRLLHASKNSDKPSLDTIPYSDLADLARNNFLAMTPDALRSLLVEFTTHGLIRTNDNTVHVALSKADLQNVIKTFSSGS
jgi:hypothetical protein